jgi:hypothetical protein
VKIRAESEVRRIGDGDAVDDRDVAGGGLLGALSGGGYGAIAAAFDVVGAHESSVISR